MTVLWGLSQEPFQQAMPRDLSCEPPPCYVQAVEQLRYTQTVVAALDGAAPGSFLMWTSSGNGGIQPLLGDCSVGHSIGTLARGHGWGPIPPPPPRPPPAPHCDLYWEMSLEKGCLGTVLWGSGPILRCKHEPNPGTPPPSQGQEPICTATCISSFVMSLYISAVLVAMPSFRGLPVSV